jgi:hypothetical protein
MAGETVALECRTLVRVYARDREAPGYGWAKYARSLGRSGLTSSGSDTLRLSLEINSGPRAGPQLAGAAFFKLRARGGFSFTTRENLEKTLLDREGLHYNPLRFRPFFGSPQFWPLRGFVPRWLNPSLY